MRIFAVYRCRKHLQCTEGHAVPIPKQQQQAFWGCFRLIVADSLLEANYSQSRRNFRRICASICQRRSGSSTSSYMSLKGGMNLFIDLDSICSFEAEDKSEPSKKNTFWSGNSALACFKLDFNVKEKPLDMQKTCNYVSSRAPAVSITDSYHVWKWVFFVFYFIFTSLRTVPGTVYKQGKRRQVLQGIVKKLW